MLLGAAARGQQQSRPSGIGQKARPGGLLLCASVEAGGRATPGSQECEVGSLVGVWR